MRKIIGVFGLVGLVGLLGCSNLDRINTNTEKDLIPISQEVEEMARNHYEILGVKDGMFIFRMSYTKDGYDNTEIVTISPNDMSMDDFKILMRTLYKND